MTCTGKKLLIVGGAFQHCKIVEAAKKLGAETYVFDYLPYEEAPAKQLADHWYQYNITDYDEIRALCETESIDGAIALCLDACQRPYQRICEMMGFPCFGTREQFYRLTDKNAFKQCCRECGVDVIPEYSPALFLDEAVCAAQVEFPVFVKPCDSRGSRGQAVCRSYAQAVAAIAEARRESPSGEVVIEQYMEGRDDFSVSYVILDGVPYLTRTGSRFLGRREDRLDRLCIAGVSPSKYTDLYTERVEAHVLELIRRLGLTNAPFFLQGFVDGDTVRFYDPGLRFPGIEYERMYERILGLNPIEPLIEFALSCPQPDKYRAMAGSAGLRGMTAVDLLIPLRPGTIGRVEGWEEILAMPEVVSGFARYRAGAEVPACGNVNQRFCEIDLVCPGREAAGRLIERVYHTLRVLDPSGEDMKVSLLDTRLLQ